MLQSFDLLDLTIALTPPPENSPVDALASMTVRCDALGLNHATGLLTDPLAPQERTDLRWYLEEYSQWPYAEFAVRGKRIEAQLSEIGKRLYQTAFGAVMGQVQPWRLLPTKQRQISIVSTVPAALSLPWELLHDEHGFLVLRTRQPVALLRRLEQHELNELPIAFKPPLLALVVTARPSGTGFLDPRSLSRELLDAVQPQIDAGAVEVEFLRPPTRAALRQRLAQTKKPVHILHFDGHGVFAGQIDPHDIQRKRGGEQGMLAFEDAEGKLDLVKAEDLAQLLQDSGVKLAVLDACQSAMSSEDNAFSSVAARLIQGGVDATVAMSASVLMVSSTRFFARFYRELAAGTPVPIAQERARQDLYDDPRRHLFRRRADEEGQPVELRDWWLPHYYQQRPLTLRATRAPRRRKSSPNTVLPRFNDDMPKEPRYHFGGRARELLQIERLLLRKHLVVLSGFGGIGKTALAREAADWLTRTGMYSCACFISFEHGGDASLLLNTLGTFLGINDGNYTLQNPDAALTRLQPVFAARPTLLIADNLESLLPTGDAPLERATRSELWHVLRELANMRVGVLLTSRDPLASEDQLASGVPVANLPLGGLTTYDAYALATRLLEDLGIDRARAPYAELRDLLFQLDHHPLAIQLALPTLRTTPLATICTDFVALLPQFKDDAETGRNRSLLASLEYSLRRLNEKQRGLLSHVVVFEGCVFENFLFAITKIAEPDWFELRSALEQAALLTVELIEGVNFPFLRFHPILIPYLRGKASARDKALMEQYAQVYYQACSDCRQEVYHYSMPILAIVQRELPNLRRAFGWVLESGYLEQAADMANDIGQFLTIFALHRERQQMHQRVAEALASRKPPVAETLTREEYLHEYNLCQEEGRNGYIEAARARYQRLLARIESQPQGSLFGLGSFQHATTLGQFGRYLLAVGNFSEAEPLFRRAIALVEVLVQHDREDRDFLRLQSGLLSDLSGLLLRQGLYTEAEKTHEHASQTLESIEDQRNLVALRGRQGKIAFEQLDYAEARKHHQYALETFRALGEPAMEAVAWHHLGDVAMAEQDLREAERCYRESLSLNEQFGERVNAAMTCNHLGGVAQATQRFKEARGWYQRAIALSQEADPLSGNHIAYLTNLTNCLVREVQAGMVQEVSPQLAEARRYAEQALAIPQFLQTPEPWKIFDLLADIAEMQGCHQELHTYRRKAREVYVSMVGNRYMMDQGFGNLFPPLVAAQVDLRVRMQMERQLSQLEASGLHLSEALHRIWAGDRDWQALVENLNGVEALFVLRVLETIAEGVETTANVPSLEQRLSTLPASIREALAEGDPQAFQQAFEALSAQGQQAVMEVLQALQSQQEDEKKELS